MNSESHCRPAGLLLVAVYLAIIPAVAAAQEWSGNGPFAPGNGSRTVHTLHINAATGTVYAGTGSGTVFTSADPSLSRPPEALDDSAATDIGTAVDIDVLANDVDPEGALDPASIQLQTGPAGGSATANADGTVTYTPDPGVGDTDSFTYTVRDLAGLESGEAQVTVQLNPPDPDPNNNGGGDDSGSGNGGGGNSSGRNTGGGGGGGGALGALWLVALLALMRRRTLPAPEYGGARSS